MQLGAFSISLAVKDIHASKAFYEKFGFQALGGDITHGWLILKNGSTVIGLFQGMFEKNMLTFNPGWDGEAKALEKFTDVRELQRQLRAHGVTLMTEADAKVRSLQDQAASAADYAKANIERRIADIQSEYQTRSRRLGRAWQLDFVDR